MKATRKLLAFLLSVCMVLTMFAGLTLPVGATTTYTASLITSDSDLTDGGLYMIVQDGHAAINTISSNALATTATYSTTGLTGTESYVWTLAGSGNLFTITSAASSAFTIGGASSATSLNSTGGSTWYIAYDTTNSRWQIRLASATGRFWGYTTSSSYAYKIYATGNYSGTTYPHNIQLYKLTANAAAATLTSIAVSGQTTSYTVGDAFSFNGTCTATYSDGTTATVTPTVSSPDMSSAGTKTVTVSYTESGVTKTTTYNITVTAAGNTYVLTYSRHGTTTSASYSAGASVTLPTSDAIEGYAFMGWTTAAIPASQAAAPGTVYAAGSSFTMPAAATTLYALYAVATTTMTGTNYEKVTAAKTDWSGKYVIADSALSASSLTNYVLDSSSTAMNSNGEYFSNTGMSLSGTTMSNVTSQYTVTIGTNSVTGSGYYYIRLDGRSTDSSSVYIGLTSAANTLSTYDNYSTNDAKWVITWSSGVALLKPYNFSSARSLQQNGGKFGPYANGSFDSIVLYGLNGEEVTTYSGYTTQPSAPTYNASISVLSPTVKVSKTTTATGILKYGTTTVTDYSPSYTSSNTSVATVNSSTGVVTARAVGTTTITVTYTVNGTSYTATAGVIVVANTLSGGYTLMTKANAPTDWSGEYVITGRNSGNLSDLNKLQILTPKWSGDSSALIEDGVIYINGTQSVEANNASQINISGNKIASAYNSSGDTITMTSTGANNVTSGGTTYTVYDRITSIADGYTFVFERVDDVNDYYTIRIKGTNYYLANVSTTSTVDNSLAYVLDATVNDTKALWTLRWATSSDGLQTTGGYTPDILLIESVYAMNATGISRSLLLNPANWGDTSSSTGDDARFRVYGSGAYNNTADDCHLAYATYGMGKSYSIYLYGNPNPFYDQIYYLGEQKTLANPVEVTQGRTSDINLTGALLPDIADYPNYSIQSGPIWSISSDTSGLMTIDPSTGVLNINGATSGNYALVTLTYILLDSTTGNTYTVATQTKVIVNPPEATYSTVIYETASGNDTEVQYTVPSSTNSLPLAAYVVNDLTADQSKTGSVVMGGTLAWTATSKNGNTVSISSAGVLDLTNVNANDIITVTVSGATGDGIAASSATYKVYVKSVDYTAQITHNNGTTGNFSVDYGTSSIPLDKIVTNGAGQTAGDSTFTVSMTNATWSVDAASGAAIVKNADGTSTLDASGCTGGTVITVTLSGMTATTTGDQPITSSVPSTTVQITVGYAPAVGVDETVVIDYDRPVTINVLANDTYSGTVTGMTLAPASATVNSDYTVTYTPSGEVKDTVTFIYTATLSTGSTVSATVNIMPAASVYYEDTNSSFTFTDGKKGEWTTDGTQTVNAQTSSLSSSDIYEYDSNYTSCATYSGGSTHKVTVSKNNNYTHTDTNPSVSFTFYGTGFDIISLTSNNTGMMTMQILDSSNKVIKSTFLDTYYGYTYSTTPTTATSYEQYTRYAKTTVDGSTVYVAYDAANPVDYGNVTLPSGQTETITQLGYKLHQSHAVSWQHG